MNQDTTEKPFRIYSKHVLLSKVLSSSTTGLVSIVAAVKNPSRRLSCFISVAFEPSSKQPVASYSTQPVWSVTPLRLNRHTNQRVPLQVLSYASAANLPAAIEVDTAVREFRIAGSLYVPKDSTPATIAGDWVLLVEWEPNQPGMCVDEWEALFKFCDATLEGQLQTHA